MSALRNGSPPRRAADAPLYRMDPEPSARLGRGTRLLLWCGGTDPTLLATRVERYLFVNLGVWVVLVAGLAGVSVTVLGRSAFPTAPLSLVLGAAALWAVVIFVLDRSIVADPGYGALHPPGRGALKRGLFRLGPALVRGGTYLVRILVAGALAWLIGEALVLGVFTDEVRRELTVEHDRQFLAEADRIAAGSAGRIAELQRSIAGNTARREEAAAAAVAARARVDAEKAGGAGSSGRAGAGTNTEIELAAAQAAEQHARDLSRTTGEQDVRMQGEIDQLSALALAVRSGSTEAINESPVLRQARADIYANNGLAEQEAALGRYLTQHADQPTVFALPWVLRGLLLVIDLMPLLIKIRSRYTLYGESLRRRAREIHASDAGHGLARRRADLARVQAEIDLEVEESNALARARALLGRPYPIPDGQNRRNPS